MQLSLLYSIKQFHPIQITQNAFIDRGGEQYYMDMASIFICTIWLWIYWKSLEIIQQCFMESSYFWDIQSEYSWIWANSLSSSAIHHQALSCMYQSLFILDFNIIIIDECYTIVAAILFASISFIINVSITDLKERSNSFSISGLSTSLF